MPTAIVSPEPGAPAALVDWSPDDPQDGEVLVDVAYSSLNYKDGLAVTGAPGVVSHHPLACGIDLAGTVVESRAAAWKPGDEVIATGWGLSMTHGGGYAQRQRVPGDWLIRRPESLDLRRTMAVGTAGLTAMLAILALEDAGLRPGGTRPVLVTGAAGGVGSISVLLLSALGYQVAASTGRPETASYLQTLGATEIVDRADPSGKIRPLDRTRWDGVIDSVGSTTLATALAQTAYGRAVVACGLAGGADLPTTVMPFIIRGVSLLGIDSVQCPTPRRARAWQRLETDLRVDLLDALTTVEPLSRVPDLATDVLAGRVRGRTVIGVAP